LLLARPAEVEYGSVMDGILRRSLVLLLAIALVAGGIPFAHAMPGAHPTDMPSAQPTEMAHRHSDIRSGVTGHSHAHDGLHAQDRSQAIAPTHRSDEHDKSALDPCRCLNCGMCTTPGVAPHARDVVPERRAILVSYGRATSEQPMVMIFVDPGIPIAMA
jgi:hypothetical protein